MNDSSSLPAPASSIPAPRTAAAAGLRPPPWWMLWNNPLFRRFCRSRLRMRGVAVPLLVVLVIASFVTIFIPLFSLQTYERRVAYYEQVRALAEQEERDSGRPSVRAHPRLEDYFPGGKVNPPTIESIHRPVLLMLLALQAGLLFISGTGQVAAGMTAEADEGSVDAVRLTPMSPLAKALGYLFGLPVREYVLFASTLPFTAWCLWKGGIGPDLWLPVYGVFLLTGLLYHLTGLVSGTVLKSKRWAFLLSMALVFVLYVVVPGGARIGFPFLRYLTLWAVLIHHVRQIEPEFAAGMEMAGGVGAEGVPFFGITFSETAFTLIVQGSFVIAMIVMVWRKWKRAESHLLSKAWGLAIFVWMNLLLIGNALPLAKSGDLFPSNNLAGERGTLRTFFTRMPVSKPQWVEAVLISGGHAVLLLTALLLIAIMITPGGDAQQRGLRRAFRAGQTRAPPGSDESSGVRLTIILILLAGAAWLAFHLGVAATGWFAGVPKGSSALAFLCTVIVIALTVLIFQVMLEEGGGRGPFLATLFLGIVPLLACAIIAAAGLSQHAVYCTAAVSPLTQLAYAASRLMVLPNDPIFKTADRCFLVWTGIAVLFLLSKISVLKRSWQRRRELARIKLPGEATSSILPPSPRH